MKISKSCINSDMDWKSEPLPTSMDAARNGHVYFYRDKTVTPKELTSEEIAAIVAEEQKQREAAKATLNGGDAANGGGASGSGDSIWAAGTDSNSSSYFTANKNRRKEKALKIYLDSSPVKAS